ncbi:MAG: T9SS type A sorting domain-containing protein [Salibacteraceae bacterium]
MHTQHTTHNTQCLTKSFLNLFLTVVFLTSTLISSAQLGGVAVKNTNANLRYLFKDLQPPIAPQPQADVFYDMAAHITNDKWWAVACLDTNTIENWSALYEEVWYAHYDTTLMEKIDVMWQHSTGYQGDTVPIGLMDFNFHRLKDSALTTDSFFIFDGNNQIIDNFKFKYNGGSSGDPYDVTQWAIDYSFEPNPYYQNSDSSTPYITENLFSGAVFKNSSIFNQVTYLIDPDLIKIGTFQNPNYVADYSLRINFDDGNGFVTVDHTQEQYYTANYSSPGDKTVEFGFFDHNGNQIKSSKTKMSVTSNPKIPSDETLQIAGLNVGLYYGCRDSSDTNFREKFIIFLEGIDPIEADGVEAVYKGLVDSRISDLRNHGYTFVVVDWQNSTQSLETNANNVINLIQYLKCRFITGDQGAEQFVLMGESMGAVVGRYALRKMETMQYGQGACRPDLYHNTRLFVSIDGAQAGAYVPLAVQHLASNRSVTAALFTYNFFEHQTMQFKFLYSDAASQLLLLHTGTQYNPVSNLGTNPISSFMQASPVTTNTLNYQPHPKRALFVGNMRNLGNAGYPEYCKKVAISNGLLSGDKQLNNTYEEIMEPGDGFLNGDGGIDFTILGIRKSLVSANLDLNAIDASGSGRVYRHMIGLKTWKPRIIWQTIIRPFRVRIFGTTYTVGHTVRVPVGIDVVFDYLISRGREEFSNGATPYDNGPGGYYSAPIAYGDETQLEQGGATGLTLTIEQGQSNCYNGDPVFNISQFEMFDSNYDMTWCSKASVFNFIPTFSAMDYGYSQPLPVSYDHDILSDPIATKLSSTPFDVFMGLAPLVDYPAITKEFAVNQAHVSELNFELYDPTQYFMSNGEPMYWINREVGEDTLLLSNLTLNRYAEFSSYDYLEAGNAINPFYEYDGTAQQNRLYPFKPSVYPGSTHNSNHIYSKNGTVTVDPNFEADMYYPSPTNTKYSDVGVVGSVDLQPGYSPLPCDNNSYMSTMWKPKDELVEEQVELRLTYYPNPTSKTLNLDLNLPHQVFANCDNKKSECKTDGNFRIYNLNGVMIFNESYNLFEGKNSIQLNVEKLNLPTGTYILRSQIEGNVGQYKIQIQ